MLDSINALKDAGDLCHQIAISLLLLQLYKAKNARGKLFFFFSLVRIFGPLSVPPSCGSHVLWIGDSSSSI